MVVVDLELLATPPFSTHEGDIAVLAPRGYCARSEPLFRWWVSQCSGDRWATSTGLGEPWHRQGRALMARP